MRLKNGWKVVDGMVVRGIIWVGVVCVGLLGDISGGSWGVGRNLWMFVRKERGLVR